MRFDPLGSPRLMAALAIALAARGSGASRLQPLRRAPIPMQISMQAGASLNVGSSVETSAETAAESFDWLRHWYPVNVLDTMDPARPHAITLVGLSLVAWNDGPTVNGVKQTGTWRVFDDACPHRLGPLSEGRVEADGNLLCSYHGWRFDGSGSCASLPYASSQAEVRLKRSCRAAVGSYPVREADGLLFVFPYAGTDANAVAAEVPLPLIDELHDPALEGKWIWKIPAGARDFPCGWDGMVENTLDPAHFCSAHHGTLGNRYEDPAPYHMELTRQLTLEDGFAVDGELGRLEFKPPCLVKYAPNYAAMPFNGSLVIATYCVPTRPGWVRPLANVLLDREAVLGWTLAERALSIFMYSATPIWVGHILSSVVLHQDAGLLYFQHRNLRERGYNFATRQPDVADGAAYNSIAFLPTKADTAVSAFRTWLRTKGGAGMPWQCDDVLPPRGSEDIYDMWHAHTKNCRHCRAAVRNIEAGRTAALAALVVSVAALPDSTERTLAVLAAAAAAAALHAVSRLFYRYEYSHADEFGPLDWYLALMDRRK